VLPLH